MTNLGYCLIQGSTFQKIAIFGLYINKQHFSPSPPARDCEQYLPKREGMEKTLIITVDARGSFFKILGISSLETPSWSSESKLGWTNNKPIGGHAFDAPLGRYYETKTS